MDNFRHKLIKHLDYFVSMKARRLKFSKKINMIINYLILEKHENCQSNVAFIGNNMQVVLECQVSSFNGVGPPKTAWDGQKRQNRK